MNLESKDEDRPRDINRGECMCLHVKKYLKLCPERILTLKGLF